MYIITIILLLLPIIVSGQIEKDPLPKKKVEQSINKPKELTPNEAAQRTCNCMKLSKDTSEEGVKAFTDCNNKTKEMMAPFRENAEWMEEWKGELMKILKDCMTE